MMKRKNKERTGESRMGLADAQSGTEKETERERQRGREIQNTFITICSSRLP